MEGKLSPKAAAVLIALGGAPAASQGWTQQNMPAMAPHDAVMDAQTPRAVPITRPEQRKSPHDLSDVFKATVAEPSSTEEEKTNLAAFLRVL